MKATFHRINALTRALCAVTLLLAAPVSQALAVDNAEAVKSSAAFRCGLTPIPSN